MTLLVTGISGFVGTNLVRYWRKHEPTWNIFGTSRSEKVIIDGVEIPLLKSTDAETLDAHQAKAVIHLAGIAHDLSNTYTIEDYFKVNDEGTRTLVDAFLKSQGSVFIFVSSSKAAADRSEAALTENVTPSPVTPYGQSKLNAENYIQQQVWGDKRFYILRPAMIHGPGNKGNLNLLYQWVRRGLPFPFGKFQNHRSFHSVENFAFLVMRLLNSNAPSGIYHVADDGALSTSQLYSLIAQSIHRPNRLWNISPGVIKLAARLTGMTGRVDKLSESMVVSNSKIKTALNCSLPITLEEGLRTTIQSFDGK